MEKLKNELINDFIIYTETIRGLSPLTAQAYQNDLVEFFRYQVSHKSGKPNHLAEQISQVTAEDLSQIRLTDMYAYLSYCRIDRGNGDSTRSRKISSLKAFYNYLENKRKLIVENVARELEMPKIGDRKHVYLEVDECMDLIKGIEGRHAIRDQTIIIMFLNCGIRLSELTNIKMSDIKGDVLTIIGKGDNQRTIYLNEACYNALLRYYPVRKETNLPYLFISAQGNKINNRTVQMMLKKHLKAAALDTDKISVHKLRHTAATILFQAGVDVRTIQDVLGHKNINTTQIYTHVNEQQKRDAFNFSPLNIELKA